MELKTILNETREVKNMVRLKRIYEMVDPEDGFRILVDRLWPRGMTKERAALDLWFKELAPSTLLRKWFDHDPKKWPAFKEKYKSEILDNEKALERLREIVKEKKNVTLLYAAKDSKHNEAVLIKEFL